MFISYALSFSGSDYLLHFSFYTFPEAGISTIHYFFKLFRCIDEYVSGWYQIQQVLKTRCPFHKRNCGFTYKDQINIAKPSEIIPGKASKNVCFLNTTGKNIF